MPLYLVEMTPIGKELALRWSDGRETYIQLETLRKRCPCAECSGEKDLTGNIHGGNPRHVPTSFELNSCRVVGGYAIQPEWKDGHGSGIYSYDYLRSLVS